MTRLRLLYASTIAATLSVVFVTAITIWMELDARVKPWLVSVSGHHWRTKSWFTAGVFVLVFVVVYLMQPAPSDTQVRRALKKLTAVTWIGFVLIFGFFVWHAENLSPLSVHRMIL